MTGAGRSHETVVVPSGRWTLTLNGSGLSGGHHHVLGPDQVADTLVGDLRVDHVPVGVGVAVDLVEDEQDRLLGLAKLRQRLELPSLHVAGDDK